MYFTENRYDRGFEQMMKGIPNFYPRGSGIVVTGRFEYTADMCDCRLCEHYGGKLRGCKVPRCVCLEERIAVGVASIKEVMKETMSEIKHQHELLTNEQSYQSPALNLSSYGITSGVYGYISAPSIGMELPIYLGGNDENMALGGAHMTYTSLPVGGKSTNCVLSGHSGYIGRIFFDYIPSLSIGDAITVENYWNTLTYKVIDKQIHKKDESADCYITEGRDLLTLITCVPNGHDGFDRFYLICERKST